MSLKRYAITPRGYGAARSAGVLALGVSRNISRRLARYKACDLMIYSLRLMKCKACALMIYNSCGIDDIHGFAVIEPRGAVTAPDKFATSYFGR